MTSTNQILGIPGNNRPAHVERREVSSLFEQIFGETLSGKRAREGNYHPAPAPDPLPVDHRRIRAEVLADVVRRGTSYVKTGGKTYKLTAVEVEITSK